MLVVLRKNIIEYPLFLNLNIPYKIISSKYRKSDITLPLKFYKICIDFKPDIVHAWGSMPALVSLFAIVFLKIPLINSQITNAPPNIDRWTLRFVISKINFYFSKKIVANSYAGLSSYGVENSPKSLVIYNGVNEQRFINLPEKQIIRKKYNVSTRYAVAMVASFTKNKDYNLFVDVANLINKYSDDITFIGIGGYNINDPSIYNKVLFKASNNPRIHFTGRITDVEALVNVCDIGILFSPFGEGISNAIIEYMALGKPVIANDAGGTKEILHTGYNGYLIHNETPEEIVNLILSLLYDKDKRTKMGANGKKTIREIFSVKKMSVAFINCYLDSLSK